MNVQQLRMGGIMWFKRWRCCCCGGGVVLLRSSQVVFVEIDRLIESE